MRVDDLREPSLCLGHDAVADLCKMRLLTSPQQAEHLLCCMSHVARAGHCPQTTIAPHPIISARARLRCFKQPHAAAARPVHGGQGVRAEAGHLRGQQLVAHACRSGAAHHAALVRHDLVGGGSRGCVEVFRRWGEGFVEKTRNGRRYDCCTVANVGTWAAMVWDLPRFLFLNSAHGRLHTTTACRWRCLEGLCIPPLNNRPTHLHASCSIT